MRVVTRRRRARHLSDARAALRRYTREGAPAAQVFGEVDPAAAVVIMCLWRRPGRLAETLADLAAQNVPGGIRLVLWNNDPANDAQYRATIPAGVGGALSSVELISSPVNIGGAGRMVAADMLAAEGRTGPVVLIDDDQRIGPDFVPTLLAAWSERTFAGVWAWRIHGEYWDRSEARGGEAATYVGTGGSVVDVALLVDPRLRRALDGADLMLEDILLSWRAHRRGYTVAGVEAPFVFVDQDKDQWHALADTKRDLYARLGRFAPHPRPASGGDGA